MEEQKIAVIPYREISALTGIKSLPSVQDYLYVLTPSDAKFISNYMGNGEWETGWMGQYYIDPIDQQTEIDMNFRYDEKYTWSSLLTYLVSKYRVALPKEFISHILSQTTAPNANTRPTKINKIELSDDEDDAILWSLS